MAGKTSHGSCKSANPTPKLMTNVLSLPKMFERVDPVEYHRRQEEPKPGDERMGLMQRQDRHNQEPAKHKDRVGRDPCRQT
ncbi:MAG: hypothetical protein AAB974_04500 [Patescibacteria group bacterium]